MKTWIFPLTGILAGGLETILEDAKPGSVLAQVQREEFDGAAATVMKQLSWRSDELCPHPIV